MCASGNATATNIKAVRSSATMRSGGGARIMLTEVGSLLAEVESPTVRMILDIATGTGGNRDQKILNDYAAPCHCPQFLRRKRIDTNARFNI